MGAKSSKLIFENEKDLVDYLKEKVGKNYWVGLNDDGLNLHCSLDAVPVEKYKKVFRIYNANSHAVSDVSVRRKPTKKAKELFGI